MACIPIRHVKHLGGHRIRISRPASDVGVVEAYTKPRHAREVSVPESSPPAWLDEEPQSVQTPVSGRPRHGGGGMQVSAELAAGQLRDEGPEPGEDDQKNSA